MKKITTTIILLLTIIVSYSQQNFSELAKKYEGEQFVEYLVNERDGFRFIQKDTVNMIILKNKYGRFSGVNIVDDKNETKIKYTPGDWKLDNPSQPAFSYNIARGGYVSTISSIDGMIFVGGFSLGFREKFSSDIPENYLNNYKPSVSYIYVPLSLVSVTKEEKSKDETKTKETKTDSKKPKKKGGFLANLEAKLNSALGSMTSANLPLVLKKYNSTGALTASVKEYTTSMKAKQKPLTAADKQDYAYVKFQEDSIDVWIKGENEAFRETKEGKRQYLQSIGGGKTYTIRTNNDQGIHIINNNGHSIFIGPGGDSHKLFCGNPAYYAIRSGDNWVKGSQITNGNGVCGKTITI